MSLPRSPVKVLVFLQALGVGLSVGVLPQLWFWPDVSDFSQKRTAFDHLYLPLNQGGLP
jgi:hypothetical protein